MSMPRPTPRSRPARPRTSSASRSAARARSMPARQSCRASRSTGVDMHIGSQITELAPFGDAFALLSDFVRTLRADGHTIEHVDLGGGLGIPYREDNEPPPHPDAYAEMVKRATRDLDCTLIFEPGRLIVGNAGILVTRVLYREARRGQDLRHRRRRDERSDPPDPLRGLPRHPAGQRAARRGAADRRRRGRPGLRIRRFPGARPRPGRSRRPATSSR